ncbi:hypothetical protein YYC_01119 [Plasmodium yoelii 17X]|uniref:Uncharacterized protein n=1 Tax=Plasmodium yoelii 17X TaxID=1323249 RepID=V7PRT6_PLAYE|nr:hypothetical protein YYC_01119 [Plasmodium yoelii 17X]
MRNMVLAPFILMAMFLFLVAYLDFNSILKVRNDYIEQNNNLTIQNPDPKYEFPKMQF